MKTHTVLAIGAHVGDAELTAGALLATCAVHGGKAVTLALTAGEKGAPIGADIAAYRADKIAQAEAFARDLGGEAYVLQYEDGLVPDNDEIRFAVCDIIRKVKPDIIVTHHAQSMHLLSGMKNDGVPGVALRAQAAGLLQCSPLLCRQALKQRGCNGSHKKSLTFVVITTEGLP